MRFGIVSFRGFEIALVIAILSSGCTEHYDGTVAEFEPHPDLPVILSAKEYGDCFREDRDVPLVYQVRRPEYSVRIAHGNRYWPEWYLVARDATGALLKIGGAQIRAVLDAGSGDMKRLHKVRGNYLDHRAVLDVPLGWRDTENLTAQAARDNAIGPRSVAFEVLGPKGVVLGREEFVYRVNLIRCRAFNGP